MYSIFTFILDIILYFFTGMPIEVPTYFVGIYKYCILGLWNYNMSVLSILFEITLTKIFLNSYEWNMGFILCIKKVKNIYEIKKIINKKNMIKYYVLLKHKYTIFRGVILTKSYLGF